MTVICPKCHSERIDTRNRARKVGGTIGMAAGATTGAAGLFQGARAGWATASIIAPHGMPYTRIAGAIIGGIVGATTGCAIGVSLGELVDDNVLDNYCCLACCHTFSPNRIKQHAPSNPSFGQNSMANFNDQE
jgi:hypothetical protein